MASNILLEVAKKINCRVTKNAIYGKYKGNLFCIHEFGPKYIIVLNTKFLNLESKNHLLLHFKNHRPRGFQSISIEDIFNCIVISLHINLTKKLESELIEILEEISKKVSVVENDEKFVLYQNFPVYLEDFPRIEAVLSKSNSPLWQRVLYTVSAILLLNFVLILVSANAFILKISILIQIVLFAFIIGRLYVSKIYKPKHSFFVEAAIYFLVTLFYFICSLFTQVYIFVGKEYSVNWPIIVEFFKKNYSSTVLPLCGYGIIFSFVMFVEIFRRTDGAKIAEDLEPENKYLEFQNIKERVNKKYVPIFLVSWLIITLLSLFYVIKKSFSNSYDFVSASPLFLTTGIFFICFISLFFTYFNSFNKIDPEYVQNRIKNLALNFVMACFASFLLSVTSFVWILHANTALDRSAPVEKTGYISEEIDKIVEVDICYKAFAENGESLNLSLCEKNVGIVSNKEKFKYQYKDGFFKTGLIWVDKAGSYLSWEQLIENKKNIQNIGSASVNNLLKNDSAAQLIRDKMVPKWKNQCEKDGAACRMLAYISAFDKIESKQIDFYQKGCNLNDGNSCFDISVIKENKSLKLKASELLFSECENGLIRSCKVFYRSYGNESDKTILQNLNKILVSECNRQNYEACDRLDWFRNKNRK